MQARYVNDIDLDKILDPDFGSWRDQRAETVSLMGTPVGLQPTEAIRVAWMGKKIGAVGQVDVKALHDGRALAFRLEWEDATESADLDDNTHFPDAAAIALPAAADAPLVLMGKPGSPVNAWYWRADEPQGAREISAEGLGTSQTIGGSPVRARGVWKGGRWSVVVARALKLEGAPGAAQLAPGVETGFGVAIWEGSNQERAGIKSFSGDWLPLFLEPGTRVRRS